MEKATHDFRRRVEMNDNNNFKNENKQMLESLIGKDNNGNIVIVLYNKIVYIGYLWQVPLAGENVTPLRILRMGGSASPRSGGDKTCARTGERVPAEMRHVPGPAALGRGKGRAA
jgi:hypothetical protein